jgi:hypothetical protein
MGATDGNLTVTFNGIVVSFGLAGALVVLGEGEAESTVEVDPSSADEPSPNNPLSFPALGDQQPPCQP